MTVTYGFIREKVDIKILILYILKRLKQPVDHEYLANLTLCDDGISYFDFSDCLANLVKTEHVQLEDGLYTITEKGIRNGELTQSCLPYTVRVEAEKNASAARVELDRNATIKTSHTPLEQGGFNVQLSLSDGIGEIISMTIYAANEKQSKLLEHGFKRRAENIYNEIIDIMLNP